MTLINSYLTQGKVNRVLARRPGEAGFSLIELVVVVAVLAILSAIAIPSFTSINNKARSAAASNTVATIAKECAVKYANGEASPTFNEATLDGYNSVKLGTSLTACAETGLITADSSDTSKYPDYIYNVATGAKTCLASGGAIAYCANSKW